MMFHNTIKTLPSAYIMSFNISKVKEWMSQCKKIWNEVESQLFEKLATEPIKGNNVRGKFSWSNGSIRCLL